MKKKKKVKVCFVSLKAYQLFNQKIKATFGGAEVQMTFLAKKLSTNVNYSIAFVVGDYGQSNKEVVDGISLFKFLNPEDDKSIKAKIFGVFKLYLLMRKIDADVYITTTTNPVVGVVDFFCKVNKKKHIHRTSSDRGVNGTFISKSDLISGFLYKLGLTNANRIIVQNEEHKNILKLKHSLEAVLLKNSFHLGENKILDNQKKSILWVSRCIELKRPDIFLNLAEKFPEEKFLIICPVALGKEKFFLKIKERASSINNLEFIDFVVFDKIQEYYNEAKIFVNTSTVEGFPNTFIQACLGSTPIISLNVNPDKFLDKYECGYCAKESFSQMCVDLKNLLENKKNWNDKSLNARKYAENNHDIKKNINELEKIINDLAE